MTIEVIGTGFSRTGTSSMRLALEMLGLGPCHHMEVVLGDPSRVGTWTAFAQGEPLDFDAVFDGFRAQVDYPGVAVWRDMIVRFPEARVVHSHRPEESWWTSFNSTVGLFLSRYRDLPVPDHVAEMMRAMEKVMGDRVFEGRHRDKETAIAAYRAHNAAVVATVPADRLLVFNVAEGWSPLCRFLELQVPDAPFPRVNDTAAFWQENGGPPA